MREKCELNCVATTLILKQQREDAYISFNSLISRKLNKLTFSSKYLTLFTKQPFKCCECEQEIVNTGS